MTKIFKQFNQYFVVFGTKFIFHFKRNLKIQICFKIIVLPPYFSSFKVIEKQFFIAWTFYILIIIRRSILQ